MCLFSLAFALRGSLGKGRGGPRSARPSGRGVHACVFVCVCVCMCMRVYVFACVSFRVRVCVSVFVSLFVSVCACVYVFVRACVFLKRFPNHFVFISAPCWGPFGSFLGSFW